MATEEDVRIEQIEQLLERMLMSQIRGIASQLDEMKAGIASQLDEMKAALKRIDDSCHHISDSMDRIGRLRGIPRPWGSTRERD